MVAFLSQCPLFFTPFRNGVDLFSITVYRYPSGFRASLVGEGSGRFCQRSLGLFGYTYRVYRINGEERYPAQPIPGKILIRNRLTQSKGSAKTKTGISTNRV